MEMMKRDSLERKDGQLNMETKETANPEGGTDENTEDWQNVGPGHWRRKTGIKPGPELPLGVLLSL